ncbi:hypothetical protein VTK73DRAFT_10301 [Phialemonium thermophilum]|uniref:Rieske domain-containing protein n=1 Tax=Phialemonium thermophilum TaxID=223376 RepID=A0ABR3VXF9_9PEZI
MNPFRWPFRTAGDDWFSVGRASSFPDVALFEGSLAQSTPPVPCADRSSGHAAPCRVFQVPEGDPDGATEVVLGSDETQVPTIGSGLKDQVLVFQYKGKFHAIDHKCPHSSYPLSQGTVFDIEDFGIVLSAGLTCPKHGWSFDLFTGTADRGNYKLGVWEVQLRDAAARAENPTTSTSELQGTTQQPEWADKEVWVRRRRRMG